MRTFAALVSIDVDTTVEATGMLLLSIVALPRRKLVSRRTHLDNRNEDIMMPS